MDVVRISVEFFFLFLQEFDFIFYTSYFHLRGSDLWAWRGVGKFDISIFGGCPLNEALPVEVNVCTAV